MTNQHPSWESLVTWVEAGAEGREIAAHLAGCEPCAADAAWLAQTLDAMQGDAAFKAPPDGVRQRAIAAHRQRYPSTGHGKAQRTLPRRSLLYALLAAAALLLFMVVVQRQPSKAAPLVAVTGVEGEVTVTNRDEQTRRVMNGAPLEIGDRLTTGEDGLAIVEFRGNQAAVKVWSNSELSVDDLVVDEGQITALDITCRDGRMKATVAQPMAFTMQAYGNELTTRQGEFEVEYYRDDHSTEVKIEAGELTIANEAGRRTFSEGTELLIWYQTLPGDPLEYPLIYGDETSWRDGEALGLRASQ